MPQPFPFDPDKAYIDGPFNPFYDSRAPAAGTSRGDSDDSARYLVPPGDAFRRPWLAIPGTNIAFVWPLGVQGFRTVIDPMLGIHRYIGAADVEVDVVHRGEEAITLSGSFPGKTGADAMQALRTVVYAKSPSEGKILYLPHLYDWTQRVQVQSASFDRSEEDLDRTISYSIDFIRLGAGKKVGDPLLTSLATQPVANTKGKSAATFRVTAKYNTLRKIAAYKLKNANKWNQLYNRNEKLFNRLKVPAYKAPNYQIKLGTVIHL